MRSSLLAVLALAWFGCGKSSDMRGDPGHPPLSDAATPGGASDRDGDGLCDTTEVEFGSDPKRSDSDADGIPDLIELGNGFDATDSTLPAGDQVAYLTAEPGAMLDFPVRVTIEGTGVGVSGRFESMGSFYSDSSEAKDFFRTAQAVSADPVDGVRSIDTEAARFRSVLGRTRLEFSLRFVYAANSSRCALAYPFSYVLESDSGEVLSDVLCLLVVSPQGADTSVDGYCLPSGCQ
jgi:hypothetical protein